MGACCAGLPTVKPEDIVPDPTEPSTFFLSKQSLLSSNYKVQQDNKEGKLWLMLRKHGKFGSDDCLFVLENFVRNNPEKKDEGQALAVCKFDTLDAQAYKQYGYAAHEDSDGSDGYSVDSDSDNEEEYKQKLKWTFKTKSKLYSDRSRKQHIFNLVTKAKGKTRRDIKFTTTTVDGNEQTSVFVTTKTKVKKLIYKLTPVSVGADGVETTGPDVPLHLHGSLNKNPAGLRWESPMFTADLKGRYIQEVTVRTQPGANPAVACLLGYLVTIELSPDDVVKNLRLNWPTVFGPNGCRA